VKAPLVQTTGRDLLVADGAAEQAEACLSLLADPVRAAAMGAAARRQMESRYRWEAQLAPLAQLIGRPAHQAAA
jgi:glycosyltransferase involved in cell wall biosynthesis